MISHDSSNGAALPSARGIESLREVVRELASADGTPEDTLRASARVMCDDARARGIQVEELLVSLKRAWPTITAGGRMQRLDSSRLLSRVVTLCVQEYYAPPG